MSRDARDVDTTRTYLQISITPFNCKKKNKRKKPKPEEQEGMPQHQHFPPAKRRGDRNPKYHEEQQKDVA
jgi:hypothetical protein